MYIVYANIYNYIKLHIHVHNVIGGGGLGRRSISVYIRKFMTRTFTLDLF